MENKGYYFCDICGQKVSTNVIHLKIFEEGDEKYMPGEFEICTGCFARALGLRARLKPRLKEKPNEEEKYGN